MDSKKSYSREEVAQHNKPDDAWMIINNVIYDITEYAKIHPGGKQILLDIAGTDGTQLFMENHSYINESQLLGKKKIGVVLK